MEKIHINIFHYYYKNCDETEVFSTCKPYTIEEYQAMYSVINIDGKLYWKE